MKIKITFISVFFLLSLMLQATFELSGQFNYLSTIPPYNGGNGSGMVTFNVKASQPIRIREMHSCFSATTTQTTLIWYRTDSVNGTPAVSTANGWIQAHSYTHTPSVSGNGTMVIISDTSLNILIPAGATYGFAISSSASVRYSNLSTSLPYIISDSNLYINVGPGVGYGGTLTSPIADRAFNGKIGYVLAYQPTDAGVQEIQSPSDTICSGIQPVSVVIKNHGPNPMQQVLVEWSVNNVAQPPFAWSGSLPVNGTVVAAIGSYQFNPGTSYQIKVNTSNPNNLPDTVNNINDTLSTNVIQVKPSPIAVPDSAMVNICMGDTAFLALTLTGTPPWDLTYGDGTGTFTVNQIANANFVLPVTPSSSRTYSITSLSDGTGCVTTDLVTIDVNVFPAPPSVITPVGNTTACHGDSVTLMASVGLNFSYQWKKDSVNIPGSLNFTYYAKETGAYTVIVTSPIGCTNTSLPVNVVIHPAPDVNLGNDTALLPNKSILLDAGAGFTSYLWSTGETSRSIIVDTVGFGIGVRTIMVLVTDNNGCNGGDTIQINFTQNPGIADMTNKADIMLIPNPSDGKIRIILPEYLSGAISVHVYDLTGKQVYRGEIYSDNNISLNLTHLTEGMYNLMIYHDRTFYSQKLLIRNTSN